MSAVRSKLEPFAPSRTNSCPVGMDLAALGKKWTFHILKSIGILHVDRFNKILRSLPGLTPRVLIMRLNGLEHCGLLKPVTIQEKPRLVRWTLTDKGRDTLPILEGYSFYLAKWHPKASLENHRVQPRPVTVFELVDTFKQKQPANQGTQTASWKQVTS